MSLLIIPWKEMCHCHAWDNNRCFVYMYIHKNGDNGAMFFPFHVKASAVVMIIYIELDYTLLLTVSFIFLIFVVFSFGTQQPCCTLSFALISPHFPLPLSSLFLPLLFFSLSILLPGTPYDRFPCFSFMPNLFLSFIPIPLLFLPFCICAFGGRNI